MPNQEKSLVSRDNSELVTGASQDVKDGEQRVEDREASLESVLENIFTHLQSELSLIGTPEFDVLLNEHSERLVTWWERKVAIFEAAEAAGHLIEKDRKPWAEVGTSEISLRRVPSEIGSAEILVINHKTPNEENLIVGDRPPSPRLNSRHYGQDIRSKSRSPELPEHLWDSSWDIHLNGGIIERMSRCRTYFDQGVRRMYHIETIAPAFSGSGITMDINGNLGGPLKHSY